MSESITPICGALLLEEAGLPLCRSTCSLETLWAPTISERFSKNVTLVGCKYLQEGLGFNSHKSLRMKSDFNEVPII